MRPLPYLLALLLLATLSACRKETPAPPKAPEVAASSGSRWAAVEDLARKKDLPGAYAALEAMQVPGRSDPELTRRLAEVRRAQGEPVKAILLLRDAVALDPQAFELIAPLATLYLQVGDPAKAKELILAARQRGAKSAEISLIMGQALGQLEEIEPALHELDDALSLGANAADVHYNRGIALGGLRRHAEAVQALELAVAARPEWPAARRELARAILATEPKERAVVEKALDMLVALNAKTPEDWRLHEAIGNAWMLLGDYEAAIQSYTDALRYGKNPKQVEDRYRAAVTAKRALDTAGQPPPAK